MCLLLRFGTLLALSSVILASAKTGHHALQIIERLGFAKDTTGAKVVLGEGKRQGDSPIYYIKLPPLPYYYSNQNTLLTTPHPLKQLTVDFTSNGRPDQIYQWNVPQTTPQYFPPMVPQIIPESPMGSIFTDVMSPQESLIPHVVPSKKPQIPIINPSVPNIVSGFPSNGPQSILTQPQVYPGVSQQKPYGQVDHGINIPLISVPVPASSSIDDNSIDYSQPPSSNINEIDSNLIHKPSPTTPKPNKFTPQKIIPSMRPTPNPALSNEYGIPSKKPIDKKKPWLVIGKEKGMYVYNGRPESIYIWRPRPKINVRKHKHPMFLHFNY